MSFNKDELRFKNLITQFKNECAIHICVYSCIQKNKKLQSLLPKKFHDYSHIIVAGESYDYLWNRVSHVSRGYIAHYTTAGFYAILKGKLKSLAKKLFMSQGVNAGFKKHYHISVNGSLPEKELALVLGYGKNRRNTLVANDELGLLTVLGVLVLRLPNLSLVGNTTSFDCETSTVECEESPYTEQSPTHKLSELCTSCHACVVACPTAALTLDKGVQIDKCLQHITTTEELASSQIALVKSHWGSRFYGCTACIDICPHARGDWAPSSPDSLASLLGYVGTCYPVDADFSHYRYGSIKEGALKNQLNAGWISEKVLLRNILFSRWGYGGACAASDFIQELKNAALDNEILKYLVKYYEFLEKP